MSNLQARALAGALRFAFGLPAPLRRLIAGPPIRLDGQDLHPEAQLLLKLQTLTGRGWSTSTPESTRLDLELSSKLVAGPPIAAVDTRNLKIGNFAARLYTPHKSKDTPLLIFFHGGGWVSGSLESHDQLCRFLAAEAGIKLLAADYRLAPENPFPAAVEDAQTVLEYAVKKAADLEIDPARIVLGGDSAGGNLAAVTAHQNPGAAVFLLLFYPGVDASVRRRSRELFGNGFFLTDEKMDWFLDHYAPGLDERHDPRVSVMLAEDLSKMPPTYLATAGFDPLRDEGEAFAAKLAEAGVPVVLRRHEGLFHGFANILGVGGVFREAVAEAVGALRTGLALANSAQDLSEPA
ncbi:alpha/beta hydrolase [Lentzea sp. NBRC 105346]|uniref:alpha/beta hydrolase n=1 Tax=Lentzea sp. NBRC 105346 TaxID=3032205 RepID=UPI0024A15443|nr:alpha/beta hydrolase [Lentzea sp. NBRC 105346]GLZ32447.1 alpha/beta hydrolase [Lentzea sp. NBRC 105346]